MSSKRMLETEEEDEEMLRRAALKTMSRFKEKQDSTQSSDGFQQNNRTNNTNKANNKLNYYNNSHRNGSKRSNLIVLTKTDTEVSNSSQTDSQSNRFTKINDRKIDVSEKRKRVLPGRFSRLERDDTDEDDDEDDECSEQQYSDDNQTDSAFDQTSHTPVETTIVFDISEPLITDDSISDRIDIIINDSNDSEINVKSDSTNASIDPKDNRLTTNSIPNDSTNNSKTICDSERKETIKLISNNVSKSDALERRKQKFGQKSDEERVNSPDNCSNHTNQRTSVKNRLSNHKKNSNNNNNRNNRKTVDIREGNGSHRHQSHHSSGRLESADKFGESDDSHCSKKKLRSLVVMK